MSEHTEDLEARIAAYIDGQLPPADAARLEVFLANTDPKLAEQIIGMLSDRHRLRTLPQPKAPIDLAARVMEQVERATLLSDNHLEPSHRPWWHSRAAIAAGLLLMIGGFSYFVAIAVIGPHQDSKLARIEASAEQTRKDKTVAPVARPEKTTTLAAGKVVGPPAGPTLSPTELRADRSLAKSSERGPSDGQVDALASATGAPAATPATAAAPALPAALLPRDGEGLAMKDSAIPSVMSPAESKELAKADKVETVVQEQLQRNREVAQNGQASASKLGYASVDSPLRALTNIAASSSPSAPEPVVITLVAQDERDFARLRMALEELMTQDPSSARRQSALQTRYVSNMTRLNGNYYNNVAGQSNTSKTANDSSFKTGNDPIKALDLKPGQAKQGGQIARDSATLTNNASNNITLNNSGSYKFWDSNQREFDIVVDNNGTMRNAASNSVAANGNVAGNTVVNTPNSTIANGVATSQQAAMHGQELINGGNVTNNSITTNNGQAEFQLRQQGLQNWQTNGGPLYRVALREDQLLRLAAQFRVDSITCGRQSYVIVPEGYEGGQKLAGDERAGQDQVVLDHAAQDMDKAKLGKAATDSAKAQVPQAAATSAPFGGAPAGEIASAARAEQKAQAAAKPPMWIECIITMEQKTTRQAPPPDAAKQ